MLNSILQTNELKEVMINSASNSTDGEILCIDTLFSSESIVSGTSDGHLDLFDSLTNDLMHSSHIEYGHTSAINGISSHPSQAKCWVSASDDQSCVLWDKNQIPPASFLLKKQPNGFTDIKWASEYLIMACDYGGNLITFDPRKPNAIVYQEQISNRAIHRLQLAKDSKRFGIVSDSPLVKIYELNAEKKFDLVHEHNTFPKIPYSMIFDNKELNTYYVVGEEKYAKKVNI